MPDYLECECCGAQLDSDGEECDDCGVRPLCGACVDPVEHMCDDLTTKPDDGLSHGEMFAGIQYPS